jgi:hypothetical protein
MSAADEVSHHCYTPESIPCPDCTMCRQHSTRSPLVSLRTRYYRVMKSGKRVELTKEEYDRRLI